MGYDREEAGRQQDAREAMIRMREPVRRYDPHPDPAADAALIASRTTALVIATLSAHAPNLPEHVIRAAAEAAGAATAKRNRP